MHDSVITGKQYASQDWTCVISIFLTSFNVYFVCGCACFMCICLKTAIWRFWDKLWIFFGEDRLATLLCSLARFDLANRGVRQPVQPHTNARLLVFDETLTQPNFAVVNCLDAVMSVFYSPFSTRSQNVAVMNSCVAALSLFSSDILTWSADSLYSVQSGADPGGGAISPLKTYESSIFHHDFVQFRKTLGCQRRLDSQILLKSPLLNLRAGSAPKCNDT